MITDYASLKAALGTHLSNTAVTASAADLIQLGEARLKDDFRVRSVTCSGTMPITADGETMPADYGELDAWYHDGPTYYGQIDIVGLGQLGELKGLYGDTGVPRYAAISYEGGRVFYAPEPNATYTTRLSYFRKLTELSDANPTNWLLDEHPHIYLYAGLCEASPWLKDDARLPMWEGALELRIANMFISAGRKQFSGRLRGRPRRAIGG